MKLENKVIIVVGATGGIGSVLARVFHENGASVVLASRTESKLLELAQSLSVNRTFVVPTDAAEPSEVLALFGRAKEKFGRVDAVVISAGTHAPLSVDDPLDKAVKLAKEHFDAIFLPSFVVGFVAQQFFRQHGGGLIVNISSHAAVRTDLPGNLTYAPMKAASWSFMSCLQHDITDPAVRIVDLKPATVNTSGNTQWLDTAEKKAAAVQPEEIGQWIVDHFNDSDALLPMTVTFDAPVN